MSHTRHQKEAVSTILFQQVSGGCLHAMSNFLRLDVVVQALINASLMNLMRCLREMLNHQPKKRGGNKGGVVPFRESK
jgi:hypothetical protein